jgi:hypothetical protein
VSLTLFWAILIALLGVNITALAVGAAGQGSRLDNIAKYSGGVGLTLLVLFGLTVLDAVSQIWVMRPGYQGMPVITSALALAVCSIASSVSLSLIAYRHWR